MGMKADLEREYQEFRRVANKETLHKSPHEQQMITMRLNQLFKRYQEYDALGYDLDKVRQLEQARLKTLQEVNRRL